jgi:hypothetical protein
MSMFPEALVEDQRVRLNVPDPEHRGRHRNRRQLQKP